MRKIQIKFLWPHIQIAICFFCMVLMAACSGEKIKFPPEKMLLQSFKIELETAKKYKSNYIGYMIYQINHFKKKHERNMSYIKEINKKYQAFSKRERIEYEKKWRGEFQPVIDALYLSTHEMIVTQTAQLNEAKMAKIQELSIKMELLEKEAADEKMLPRFFVTPEIKKEK